MDFAIREANEQDYDALCALFAEVDALHREALPHVFREAAGPARTREYVDAVLASAEAALFVAETDNTVIGFIHVEIRAARDVPILVPRRVAIIDNVMVTRRLRRSGVGRALVEKALEWAAAEGADDTELNVWKFNKDAIAFYEKLGFETASRKMWKGHK